jgi:hypothetical protein
MSRNCSGWSSELSVVRTPRWVTGPDLLARVEDRLASAASELQAIRDDVGPYRGAPLGRNRRILCRCCPACRQSPKRPPRWAWGSRRSTGSSERGRSGSRNVGSARRVPVEELDAFVRGLPAASRGA